MRARFAEGSTCSSLIIPSGGKSGDQAIESLVRLRGPPSSRSRGYGPGFGPGFAADGFADDRAETLQRGIGDRVDGPVPFLARAHESSCSQDREVLADVRLGAAHGVKDLADRGGRAEERRVGKECRSRGWP